VTGDRDREPFRSIDRATLIIGLVVIDGLICVGAAWWLLR
jgi:hypothetical protein